MSDLVPAGPFGQWLRQARAFLQGESGSDVPCGTCNGCCTSSYMIQVRPEDRRTLAVVPAELLDHANGIPAGHRVMLPRPNGHCPMYGATGCTIYPDRPQTCLDYDCRVFAAAGIDAGSEDKVVINTRVRAWRFTYESDTDVAAHAAVRAAAAFIRDQRDTFPGGLVPRGSSGIAVLAIKAYPVFMAADAGRKNPSELAEAILATAKAFDAAA